MLKPMEPTKLTIRLKPQLQDYIRYIMLVEGDADPEKILTANSNGLELVASGGALIMRNAAVGMRIGGTISLPAYNINNKYMPICRLSVGISF